MTISNRNTTARVLLLLALLLAAPPAGSAQELGTPTKVNQSDLERTIAEYRSADASAKLLEIRRGMPFNRPDDRYREFQARIISSMPAEYTAIRVQDAALEKAVRQLFMPVLKLYNREAAYVFVVLNHPTPLFEINSDAVVVLTTGFLRYVKSDDEALGFIAHDIAHRLFEKEMAAANQTHESLEASGAANKAVAQRGHVLTMAQIELACDAVSAVTLAGSGYDPNAYARVLARIASDYKGVPVHGHPDISQRVKLVGALASGSGAKERKTEALARVRELASNPTVAGRAAK